MSEIEPTPKPSNEDGKTSSGDTSDAGDGFKPITSQEELNRIIGERVKRAKPADYDDLKAKAEKFDEIEQANKTEQQKLAERAEAAEKAAEQARVEAARFKVASKFGVSDEDAELFLTGTDEETLIKQAQRLADRVAEAGKPRSPKPVPNVGRHSAKPPSVADQFAEWSEATF